MQTLVSLGKTFAGARMWALAGLLGGVSLAVLIRPAPAAFTERYSGIMCQPRNPTTNTNFYMVGASPGELRNDNTLATAYYSCPIPEKTDINQYSISTIEAYVNDQNDNSTVAGSDYQAMARVCSFAPGGGGCGTAKLSAGIGYQKITVTNPDINEIDHYGMPYVYFSLPRKDIAASALLGLVYYKTF